MSQVPRHAAHKPAHGGHPTPDYYEVGARRRFTSQALYGHTGAWCYAAVTKQLECAAAGLRDPYRSQTRTPATQEDPTR